MMIDRINFPSHSPQNIVNMVLPSYILIYVAVLQDIRWMKLASKHCH